MLFNFTLSTVFVFGFALSCIAQDEPKSKPIELDVIKESVGVWDAKAEVWAQGPDATSMKFDGVETNTAYGEYWIASDSEYMGMKLHSIMGYDLDKKNLVGTVIDHGPYSASMTGEYDDTTKTVTWITNAKAVDGSPMLQKTTITHKSAAVRVLVLSVPGEKEGEFVKFMQITFVKRGND